MTPAYRSTCVVCGGPGTNRHERLPRGRGGPVDEFNTVVLCGSGTTGCHGLVTGNPAWATSAGLTVSGDMLRGRYRGPDMAYRRHYNEGAP